MLKRTKLFISRIPKWLKITFVVLVIGGLVFSAVIYFTTQSRVSNELSERSKEYLKSRNGDNQSTFDRFDVEGQNKAPKPVQGLTQIDKCFSLEVPFVVKEKRTKEGCFVQFILQNPHGFVVIYQRALENPNISELSDIQLRRSNPQSYQEEIIKKQDQIYYIYKKQDQKEYEKIAFTILPNGQLLVVSLTALSNENFDAKFDTILKSVKF